MKEVNQYPWISGAYGILLQERLQCWRSAKNQAMDILNRLPKERKSSSKDKKDVPPLLAVRCLLEILLSDLFVSDRKRARNRMFAIARQELALLLQVSSRTLKDGDTLKTAENLARNALSFEEFQTAFKKKKP